jgi:hypothetical protein
VSRLSYQKGYSLGNKGKASSSGIKEGASVASAKSEPVKTSGRKSKLEQGGNINISYGETLPIGELTDVESFASGKVPKGLNLGPGKSKKLGPGKSDAGFLKAKK